MGFLFSSLISCGTRRIVVDKRQVKSPEVVTEAKALPKEKSTLPPAGLLTSREKILNYIETYAPIAQEEMKSAGIPASITLAQGILESGMGYGRLAVEGNNHFGIKCHITWEGPRLYHDDDEKGECFRVYTSARQSFHDHSQFLQDRPRYASLFLIPIHRYEAWAKGLKKAGYATDPKYADKLISLIERFELDRFDDKKNQFVKSAKKTPIIEHKVVKGDTLYSMSKKYKVSIEAILQLNNLVEPTIYLGQILQIPTP
jgi:flagellum-specific peptidoglycan hydrolase FlgJ